MDDTASYLYDLLYNVLSWLHLFVESQGRVEGKNWKDIYDDEHYNNMVLIKIPQTKNDLPQKFTIDGVSYQIFKSYEALQPKNAALEKKFSIHLNRLSSINSECEPNA